MSEFSVKKLNTNDSSNINLIGVLDLRLFNFEDNNLDGISSFRFKELASLYLQISRSEMCILRFIIDIPSQELQ